MSCIVDYVVEGEKENVESLYNKLKELWEENDEELWAGDILSTLLDIDPDDEDIDYGGTIDCISDLEIESDGTAHFNFDMENKRSSCREVIYKLCDEFGVEFHFLNHSEENCYYEKSMGSDKWFPENFVLEDDNNDCVHINTYEEVEEAYQKATGEEWEGDYYTIEDDERPEVRVLAIQEILHSETEE